MRLLASLLLACSLAACSIMTRVEGDEIVNDRLVVHVNDAWNRIADPWEGELYDTWTQEGLPLDQLRIWGAVKPGQTLMNRIVTYSRGADSKDPRVPTFKEGLPAEKVVNLFEELYANEGAVQVTKVDRGSFAGQPGVRFEFTLDRRSDDLVLKGVGWFAVRKTANGDELYAATFVAPQLAFFDRLLPQAEAVVKTARIKG
ncbi:hypothetical protein HHL11_17345 [Ramlibacter sp. G-1-2-2]|uniref:Lipoprotein n=1 Tax=Ramlibacter agri TaxID=2728837 RepID=A0A848H7S1_9BURK|nr:hypothetical protein [Ramlibacter agri]NML45521.1 hypothetical protein [Ramlibacter agri]